MRRLMPARFLIRAATVAVLACALAGAPGVVVATAEPSNALFLVGGSPNFPRQVNATASTSTWSVLSGTDQSLVSLRVTIGTATPWSLHFGAPTGDVLGTGDYLNAAASAASGIPRLDVFGGDGFGCSGVAGSFNVAELARDGTGVLSAFAADFNLRCTNFTSSPERFLSGAVRYQSTVGWHGWSGAPTSISFPDQAPGTTGSASFVSLTNVGSLPVDFEATVSGIAQPEFVINDVNDCLDVPVDAGESCELGVAYAPWRVGSSPATLKITRQGVQGILPVALSGTGKDPTTTQLVIHSDAMWPWPGASVQAFVTPWVIGNVTFNDADTGFELESQAVGSQQASFPFFLPLAPGERNLIAHYTPNSGPTGLAFPSDSDVVHTTVLIATETTLSATGWVDMGESIELYATVKSPGSFRLTNGTLSIVDLVTNETITSVPVTDDYPEARAVIRLFEPGLFHKFEARYSGYGQFAPSVGQAEVSVTAVTAVSADASDTSVDAGSQVTIEGDVIAPVGQQPSAGTLEISTEEDGVIDSEPVTAGDHHIATTVTVPAGTNRYDITYRGNSSFLNSTASVVVEAVQADSVAPSGTVSINAGAQWTKSRQVTLRLTASDPVPGTGIAGMQFSLSGPTGAWTASEPYSTTKTLNLTGNDGMKTVHVRFVDGAGNSRVASDTIVLDTAAPLTPPTDTAFTVGSQIGTSQVPVRVSYSTTDATSGLAFYALSQSTNGGSSWTPISLPTSLTDSVVRNLTPGSSQYRFRASATDEAGNVSSQGLSSTTLLSRLQESSSSIAYTGTWATKSASKASGGKYRVATGNSSAFVNFTGSDIGLVMRLGPNCGKAAIYLDGVATPVATIDLYSASVGWRRVVQSISLPTSGPHRLEVRALGTKSAKSTGTQVGLDAVVILK
jgi:hypothetical protein